MTTTFSFRPMKQGWLLLCITVSVVLGGAYDSQIQALFSTTQSGDGTYYGYTSGGSCTLDPTPASGLVDMTVAMNSPQYYGSEVCGMCLQLTGTGVGLGADPIVGTYTVFVNNLCPECASGDLDLGDVGDGRWDISWVAVPCPTSGNLQYMAQGSHQWYIKLQVRNHRIPVADVQIKQGSSYVTLSRTSDNFFVSAGDVTFPLPSTIDIRVRAVDGQTVDDQVTLANIQSGLPFNSVTGVQFSVSGASPSSSRSKSAVASPSKSAASSPSKTPSPSNVAVSSATSTRTPSATHSNSGTRSASPSKSASQTPSPSSSRSKSAVASPSKSAASSPSKTRSPSTAVLSASSTRTPSATHSNSGSRSASPSKSVAKTPSPTASPTSSRSRTSSASRTPSRSKIASPSATSSQSRGGISASRTKTISVSPSHTRTPSVSRSRASASPTRSRSPSHSKSQALQSPTRSRSRSQSKAR